MTLKRIVLLRRDSERLGALLSGRANAENAVIRLLDDKLSRADLVESLDEAAHIVTMDSIVAVRRPSQSRPRVLRLVYPDEAVPEGGRISVLSPLGACVLGHPEGEVCDSGGMPFLEAMVVESVTRMTGLLEDLDMPTPPLGSIGIGQLIARIDRSWDTRAELRAKIGERLPALRERTKQTNNLLLGLLEERRAGGPDALEPPGAGAPH